MTTDTRWLVGDSFAQPVAHSRAFGVCLFQMMREDADLAISIAAFIAMMKRMPFPKPDVFERDFTEDARS